jgi:hypothetical protein
VTFVSCPHSTPPVPSHSAGGALCQLESLDNSFLYTGIQRNERSSVLIERSPAAPVTGGVAPTIVFPIGASSCSAEGDDRSLQLDCVGNSLNKLWFIGEDRNKPLRATKGVTSDAGVCNIFVELVQCNSAGFRGSIACFACFRRRFAPML